ncbi:MAG: MarR family transcriptional regulator [Tyzzerella sp.]|uniref:MarR family transcriptional regulator n=1 Tax=Candidatus Fimicola merdigallinarum TaxID=2840819 RepID=A0A9D9H3K1_9FIRM|nr:MarR family transcriptional regulator [Candidatus Fimicola merdigallinarum]
MEETLAVINKLLVEVFNDILLIEESALKSGQFNDVSVTEMHTIEEIGMYEPKSMSEIAKKLKITVGTLTVAINNLVKKGYCERYRSENDRRVVKVGLTKKGRLLYRVHEKFHTDMVKTAIANLSAEEDIALRKALENLSAFLKENYNLNCK